MDRMASMATFVKVVEAGGFAAAGRKLDMSPSTVTLHVQASPDMSLHDAHVLGGKVKGAIRAAEPRVDAVLVHLEPFEERTFR